MTISRGRHDDALSAVADLGSVSRGHAFATVPFLGEHVPMAQAWPRRIATQRGIHRILRATSRSTCSTCGWPTSAALAAAAVARDWASRSVFTLAPDPHAVIHALDMTGALTRATSGRWTNGEHYWFRTRLVQRLAADAAQLVLFPRPEPDGTCTTCWASTSPDSRSGATPWCRRDRPRRDRREPVADAHAASGPALQRARRRCVRSLPEHRRSLPLAVTVGRLHRVKGMATLVEAWAGRPALRQRCNLLIVGGDLDHPSADEQEQLDRIASRAARGPAPLQRSAAAGSPAQRRGGPLAALPRGTAAPAGRPTASTCAAASRRSSAWR